MKEEIYYCDICDMDGIRRKAVAKYMADDNAIYCICTKHLSDVKKTKLDYWNLE